jgi:hypothetical protein
MVSFTSTFLVATMAVVSALAGPTPLESRSTPNQQGNSGGYFYQFCILCPMEYLE